MVIRIRRIGEWECECECDWEWEGEGEGEMEGDFSCLHTIYQNHLCALLFHF